MATPLLPGPNIPGSSPGEACCPPPGVPSLSCGPAEGERCEHPGACSLLSRPGPWALMGRRLPEGSGTAGNGGDWSQPCVGPLWSPEQVATLCSPSSPIPLHRLSLSPPWGHVGIFCRTFRKDPCLGLSSRDTDTVRGRAQASAWFQCSPGEARVWRPGCSKCGPWGSSGISDANSEAAALT